MLCGPPAGSNYLKPLLGPLANILQSLQECSQLELALRVLVNSYGSCLQHAVPELCRSGWGVVATDAEGFALAAANGPVPRDFPQTAVAAEHLAMEQAIRLIASQVTSPFHRSGV